MREMKFRAWDGTQMKYDYRDVSLWNGLLVAEGDTILLQFTGLKDRTGKEIYEGDIVRTENEDVSLSERSWEGVVTYQGCMYVLMQRDSDYTPSLQNRKIVSLKVIGNVYE